MDISDTLVSDKYLYLTQIVTTIFGQYFIYDHGVRPSYLIFLCNAFAHVLSRLLLTRVCSLTEGAGEVARKSQKAGTSLFQGQK